MKINKLYSAFLILTTLFMAACSEYEDTVEPSPLVPADNPAARFLAANKTSLELDPNDISFQLKVARDNPSAALEIPVTVVADTANVFNVPAKVSFAAGEDTTLLTITMKDDATKGVDYGLELKFEEQFTSPYKSDFPSYKGAIAISIWSNMGTVQFYDEFSFYQVAEVTMWQHTETPNVYRISSPYEKGILEDAEWEDWIGGKTQDKIVFTITGENVTWDKFWYTNLLYEAEAGDYIKAYLPSAIEKEGDEESVVVKDDDGNILYFELYPSFYIDGLGGFGLNAVYVGFPGFDLAGMLELPVFGK